MEVWDHVVAVLQDPVERAGLGDEALSVRRLDQLFDERVDDLALDPDQVAAAGLVGRFRAPIFALLIAGRQRLAKGHHGHVVIEGLHPLLVLRRVDRAHPRGDPHPLEVLGEGQHDPLELRIVEQNLELEGLPRFLVDELLALKVQPASFNSFNALRIPSRILPEPSYLGGSYSVANTGSGIWPRNFSRIASSSPCGTPVAANSELSK